MSAKAKSAKATEAPKATEAQAPEKEVKATAKSVERKILQEELISLQKEGRLTSYDSATGIGTVLSVGKNVKWPGDGNGKV